MDEILKAAFHEMEVKASEYGATGVMAIAWKSSDGKIKMILQACGKEFDDWGNYYSIACAKIMEMVRTGKESGTLEPLAGEFKDFVGGTLDRNYYVTFSGAEGHVDLEIAKIGLEILMAKS